MAIHILTSYPPLRYSLSRYNIMETATSSESADEFFGDQSSESDTPDRNQAYSETMNGAAAHKYRSHESSIKTLSYLDGFDENKEDKMQDGFCDGQVIRGSDKTKFKYKCSNYVLFNNPKVA